MNNRLKRYSLVLLLVCLNGCSTGKDSILFLTKTSVGVDVDSKPPTLDIGFNRKEGTIAPVFENGLVLPQMAGFTSKLGIINQAIGQSFATGNAAILMGKYLSSGADPVTGTQVLDSEITGVANVNITTGERKRYFFGTDTSFGFRVNFGLETGGLPDALSLGYKRKELAYVPLIQSANSTTISLPSLLATSGLEAASTTPDKSNLRHVQFFATGKAADYLAAQSSVRKTIGPRISPDFDAALDSIPSGPDVFEGDGDGQ